MKRFLMLILIISMPMTLMANEGLWTFDAVPKGRIEKEYKYHLTDGFLSFMRMATLRMNVGGSGSFVSQDGLIMTNHHIAHDCLAKLSSKEHDYVADGFYAPTVKEERKCPDLEVNRLMAIQDVTKDVLGTVKKGMSEAQALHAKKAMMSKLEKACTKKTGMRCDVVTLYHGGKYMLYRYKRYTDIRVVFAPEFPIAFFGGNQENFTFPRYDLDVAFLRAYENNKPVQTGAFLHLSPNGPGKGDLVFVVGNPGRTGRLLTVEQLKTVGRYSYPFILKVFKIKDKILNLYAAKGAQEARRSQETRFYSENSIKAITGFVASLKHKWLWNKKQAMEKELKAKFSQSESGRNPWQMISQAQSVMRRIYKEYYLLERGYEYFGHLHGLARGIVRYVVETAKPNARRLRRYRDSNLPSVRMGLMAKLPIYMDYEILGMRTGLEVISDLLGKDSKIARALLQGKSADSRANEVISGTKVGDLAFRKRLMQMTPTEIKSCKDPLIRFVLLEDRFARKVLKEYQDRVEGPQKDGMQIIARIRFKTYGDSIYPDATFTPRIAFGAVKGYKEGRTFIEPFTKIAGLYKKAGSRYPYKLPQKWVLAKSKIDMNTPMNFCSTNDIIGGNSGSPVIDTEGRAVGLIFDGNIESLGNRFVYSEKTARAVSVDTAAILEALKKVYNAPALVWELLNGFRR